jgi:hypothetical protein
MHHEVSIAQARREARRAGRGAMAEATVGADGRLVMDAEFDLGRLGPKKNKDAFVILYDVARSADGTIPEPLSTDDGARAVVVPCAVCPDTEDGTVTLGIDVRLPGHEGERVAVLAVNARRRRLLALAAATVAVPCVTAAALLCSWGDPAARRGHYEGMTPEEIRAELSRDVAWHSMEISVAPRVRMTEGSTSLEARIENPEANRCDQKVKVWEAGREGDVLYESGAIAPGEHIQHVKLAHPLPLGTHRLIVEFQGYDRTPALLSDEGVFLGHDTFGASCAAEMEVEVVPAG